MNKAALFCDPASDFGGFPPTDEELLLPGKRGNLLALYLRAGGAERKPTVLLLHGYPGNEQNYDLAQALRRTGLNVLTMHYSGSWGSGGVFSFSGCIEDAQTGLAFLREPENVEKYRVDTDRIYVIGHSMGGFMALYLTALDRAVAGTVALAPFDFGWAQKMVLTEAAQLKDTFESSIAYGAQWLNADPKALLRELAERQEDFDLAAKAEILADRPILIITGSRDEIADEAMNGLRLYNALAAYGKGKTAHVSLPSGHSFANRRIALIHLVADKLEKWLAPADRESSASGPA